MPGSYHLLQAADESGHLRVFRFLASTIDDETGRHLHDLVNLDETVLCQRPAGFDQIHNTFAQSDEGSELNRSRQTDDLHWHPFAVVIAFGDVREFSGDADIRPIG